MEEIIRRIIDNEFADLRGLKISGKIPVDPAFVNEMITAFLKPAGKEEGESAAGSGASPAALPEADYRALLSRHVKKLEVDVEGDKIVVYFDVRV